MIKEVDSIFLIQKGDIIHHPVFLRLKVVSIFKIDDRNYESYCELLDFGKAHVLFDSLALSKLKFKISHVTEVK